MQPVITRYEARALGLVRYFNGKPCEKAGHLCERYTRSHRCVECSRIQSAAVAERRAAPIRAAKAEARRLKIEADEARRAERRQRREEMASARAANREARLRPIDRICQKCAQPFVGSSRAIYCSDVCRDEVRRAGVRAWKKANPDTVKAQRLAATIRNPERNRNRARRWAENNPERRKLNLFTRKAREQKARAMFDELVKSNPNLASAASGVYRGGHMLNALKALGVEVHI